ncbi:MAG: hypothetical protein VX498_06630, partial [Myxococcota bacterium]|nr:hypothetical protein [Myxococcota bacterium]
IEELFRAEGPDRFYGTLLAGHFDFYAVPGAPPREEEMFIFSMRGDGRQVEEVRGLPNLCWIGSMLWSEERNRLYIGCEFEPVIQRFDSEAAHFDGDTAAPEIGDVAAMVLDEEGGRLFTTSFWNAQVVAEIDPDSMELRQSRHVGGANVDLAFDPVSQRLFVTGYYDSRVRVLRAEGLTRERSIPTGFGTRAVAVDSSRDLLLASSVYDGLLRVCRASDGATVEHLAVGGHVKDIAIDSQRGLAWFWSQCGLFRLDLKQLRNEG